MNLEKINEYYKSLDIKTYWSTESLSVDQINIITRTFKGLHKIYPDVIIKEIGDFYSIDKLSRQQAIESGNKLLNEEDFSDNEYYMKNPQDVKKTKEIVKKLLDDIQQNVLEVYDNKYINAKYSAKYFAFDRKIIFNQFYHWELKEILFHEFGHAVAFQYNINNNKAIKEIFNNIDKKIIKKLVSDYATTEVEEFIAEVFMYHHLQRRNSIINKVMSIINEEIKNGKAMSETERFLNNAIYGEL